MQLLKKEFSPRCVTAMNCLWGLAEFHKYYMRFLQKCQPFLRKIKKLRVMTYHQRRPIMAVVVTNKKVKARPKALL
jgi:hypothetical protein